MVSKRGVKRTATGAKEGAVKKVKCDPMLQSITEAVLKSSELSQSCQKMIIAMLPSSLRVPSDERNEQQSRVVAMVEEVLGEVRRSLEKDIENEEVNIKQVEQAKGDAPSKIQAAEERLAEAKQATEEKKTALAATASQQMDAKKALAEMEAAQVKASRELMTAQMDRGSLEEVISGSFKALQAGESNKAETQGHLDSVMPLVKGLGIDESLLKALPAACMKPLASRGDFDNMVMGQLEESLQKRFAELEALVQTKAPAAAERLEAVEAATKSLESAKAIEVEAAAIYKAAQEEEKKLAKALSDCKTEEAGSEAQVKKIMATRDEKGRLLELFDSEAMRTFSTLKTKTNKKIEAVASVEEPVEETAVMV